MRRRRILLWALAAILLALHNDLWQWHDARRLLGLPIGLAYHLLICLAAALLMAALVRHAWPRGLDRQDDEGERP